MPPSSSTTFLLSSLERPARALVIGASGGIGSAVTGRLTCEGFETVHALSRWYRQLDGRVGKAVAGAAIMLVYISLRGQPSNLAPGSKGVVSGGSVLTGGKAMAAELEVVVDRSVIDPA